MKKILFPLIIAVLTVTACKKDKSEVQAPTLTGKWGIANMLNKEIVNGATMYSDNYTGTAADYMEFKTDNTLSYFVDGFGLILSYQILPDNKLKIEDDIFTIQSLTKNSASLILKESYGTNTYDEITINLKR
jgi:hypothetical protein